ncbi:hypothetical protein CCO03_11775 [Comamonas serinivorans]|uniref:WxL domain-containing protein n=1 Tax=Comamonas serinivorans TaxID=1082851 RepID=A0A1Y0ETA5_9BURK|nr:hypothetical protein [Comamonas serinivorans]ARU06816.1 hypothetical protein CCO03_11775 [Comamonas serinivorans]
MKVQARIVYAALGVALSLGSQLAHAEASYGYQSSGTGAVNANARVRFQVNVPKLILLRVGADDTTVNTVAWDVRPNWVTAPGSLTSGATSSNTPWNGAAPTFTAAANPTNSNVLTAYAWTNGSGATLTQATSTAMAPTTGPTMTNITVTSTGALTHPGANLGTASPTSLAIGTAYTGTWTYGLDTTNVASWPAGTYTATVTYTASSL